MTDRFHSALKKLTVPQKHAPRPAGTLEQEDAAKKLRMLSRQSFFLWMFIAGEGLFEDALAFLEETRDAAESFEWDLLP